ncbi:MAG: 4Fe-4S dicluster domain-containing protein [Burkholderiaceae bacterium]
MKKQTALPVIDLARCTGCGWCVAACAPHVLSLETVSGVKRSSLHDAAGCTGCALCAVRCPFDAIAMVKKAAAAKPQTPSISQTSLVSTNATD